jgi:hypothetical protein
MPVGAALLVRSGGSLQSIQALAVKEATHSVRRVACRAHAAVGARQETLPFRQRNPECRRDLLQCYTVDLVHEQDFSLARSKHAAPPIGVEGGERISNPSCAVRAGCPRRRCLLIDAYASLLNARSTE